MGIPTKTELNAVLNHPLWRRLSAVQRGRAIRVEDDHWYLGIGPLAASQVLDDLERFLLRTP
ncbi:MAG: hypothetical protein N2318_09490 [Meiothermus sp.]|jgi:iron complex transport system substrate-binding protein|nr:hypothetical protein [Meiothermus sp.]GAO76093.1 periplasmic binding protein [Meiothermus ruber H328]